MHLSSPASRVKAGGPGSGHASEIFTNEFNGKSKYGLVVYQRKYQQTGRLPKNKSERAWSVIYGLIKGLQAKVNV